MTGCTRADINLRNSFRLGRIERADPFRAAVRLDNLCFVYSGGIKSAMRRDEEMEAKEGMTARYSKQLPFDEWTSNETNKALAQEARAPVSEERAELCKRAPI